MNSDDRKVLGALIEVIDSKRYEFEKELDELLIGEAIEAMDRMGHLTIEHTRQLEGRGFAIIESIAQSFEIPEPEAEHMIKNNMIDEDTFMSIAYRYGVFARVLK